MVYFSFFPFLSQGNVTKPVEMTSVVPVSGLIFARFHMYGCELGTALELWSTPGLFGKEGEKILNNARKDKEQLL